MGGRNDGRIQPPAGSTPRQRKQFYQDLKRDWRAEQGRCVYCGKLPEPGRRQCARHLELARRRNAAARERRRAAAEAARRAAIPRSCSGCGGADLIKNGHHDGRQVYRCRACRVCSYGDGPAAPRPKYPCPYCGKQCYKFGHAVRVRRHNPQVYKCPTCGRTNINLWPEDTPSPGGPFPHRKTFDLNVPAHEALLVYCQEKKMSVAQAVRDIFIQAAKAPASLIGVGRLRGFGAVSSSSKPRVISVPGPPLPVIPPGGVRLPSAMPEARAKLQLRRQQDGKLSPTVLMTLRVCVCLNDLALASLLEMMRRRGLNHQDTARSLIAETNAPKRALAPLRDDGGIDGW